MLSFTPFPSAAFDPFVDVRRLHDEMNRLFDSVNAGAPVVSSLSSFPPVNIWAGAEGLAVTAEVPGVSPDDVEVTVTEDVLTIAGERKAPAAEEGVEWRRRERAFGPFRRVVQLPYRVDPDKVSARFRDGVLEVELHRPEEDKPRRIAIKS